MGWFGEFVAVEGGDGVELKHFGVIGGACSLLYFGFDGWDFFGIEGDRADVALHLYKNPVIYLNPSLRAIIIIKIETNSIDIIWDLNFIMNQDCQLSSFDSCWVIFRDGQVHRGFEIT